MNKKTFIKKLKEKLSILDSEEVKDIISEYTDTIDEKIKNGEKEEDAIADFGDIDELAKEILKAYKINPKYSDKKEESKDFVNGFENTIKKGASKLSQFTKDVVDSIKKNDTDFTLQTAFEIILKALVLLLIIAVLRLPFMFLSYLGESILDVMLFPIDAVLIVVWKLIVWALYILAAILIGMTIFKNNIKVEKSSKKKESNKEEKVIKEEIEEIDNTKKVGQEKHKGVSNALTVIIKVFVTIFILIPLILLNVGLFFGILLCIYYLCQGINLLGPLFILIGIMVMTSFIADIFGNIFKNKRRNFIIPIIVSLIFFVVGTFTTFIKARDYEFYNEVDHNLFKSETVEHTKEINEYLQINGYFVSKVYDEEMMDNQVKIIYTYYPDVLNIEYDERKYSIEIDTHDIDNRKNFYKIYDHVIDHLKKDEFYRYDEFFHVEIKVVGNEETLRKVRTF